MNNRPASDTRDPRIVECCSFPIEGSQYLVDAVRYQPTDRPIEDRWSFNFDPHTDRVVLGVYDGHGGSETAELVSAVLPAALIAQPSPSAHAQTFQDVDAKIIKNFTNDHSVFHRRSDQWVDNARVAKAGCTALIFDLDLKTMAANVANAGDCRLAVFHGDTGNPGRAVVSYETTDLNAKSVSEQAKVKKEHPGEDMIFVSGRLFGRVMSTRGFGDAYYKLPCQGLVGKYTHKKLIDAMSAVENPAKVPINQQYDSYFYGYLTPPYIEARPETSLIHLTAGDIVLLASDGLWDRVSTREAADILSAGLINGTENLALHVINSVISKCPPGDDTAIVILRPGMIPDVKEP
ncbi:hypothetical protein H1R20_g11731, partial [Candolleomyces eurysporus]